MDKSRLIEIATFSIVNNSAVYQSMLEDEGIEFFVRNENIASIYTGVLGGAGIVVKEEDAERAIEIAKEAGFTDALKKEFKD